MKKLMAFLMAVIMLMATLGGCAEENTVSSDPYISIAQDFIDDGNYEAAIDVLQGGFDATGNADLAVMLAEVLSLQNAETTQPEDTVAETESTTEIPQNAIILTDYADIWATADIGWQNGGMILDFIFLEGGDAVACLQLCQSSPGSRVAYVDFECMADEIDGNRISHYFDDDGWGNHGLLTLEFADTNTIICTVSDYTRAEMSMWGLHEGEYTLTRNSRAFELMIEPTEDSQSWPGFPAYDPSKASGILMQSGLTEQEFRDLCQPIATTTYGMSYNWSNLDEVGNFNKYHLAWGLQYYQQHPEDPKVAEATAKWDAICEDYQTGGKKYENTTQWGMSSSRYHLYEKYQDLETYLNDTVYCPKGYNLIQDFSEDVFEDMKENPNTYLGMPYVLTFFPVSANTGIMSSGSYVNTSVIVVDLRDDIHNPNLLSENDYLLYVIFDGTFLDSYGRIGLRFSLLSVEKDE